MGTLCARTLPKLTTDVEGFVICGNNPLAHPWEAAYTARMTAKTTDSKGRVTLGGKFANRTVLIEEIDETEVRVTLARVIPEREAWLWKNKKALAMVQRGLEQARKRQSVPGPDLKADAAFVARIKDDE